MGRRGSSSSGSSDSSGESHSSENYASGSGSYASGSSSDASGSGSNASGSSHHSSEEEERELSKPEKKERKKWKKQMKKGLIAPGTKPPWKQGGEYAYQEQPQYGVPPHGAPGGAYGAPGAYPAQPYPAGPQGYPIPGQPQGYPAPGQAPGFYPAPEHPQGYPAPGQAQGYPAPGQALGYPAPGQGQGYPAPGQGQGYPAPGQAQGYPAPGQAQGYPAPGQGQGYPAPGQAQGYPAPGQGQGYPDPGQGQRYPASGQPQGYPALGQPQGYPDPGQAQGYPAPGQAQGYPAPGQGQGYPIPGQAPGYPAPGAVFDPNMAGPMGMAPPGAQPPPGDVHGIGQQLQQVQLDGCAELFRPTVRPAANFSAEEDCEALRHSMKGAGTDEGTIVGIIGQRSNSQRQEIAKFYKTMFGRDIIQDLGSELSGNFREAIMALFQSPGYYDAWSLHNAMEGVGTKEGVLIEILCTRTNQQIRDIVACYKQNFKHDLEKDIISETSGHLKKLLVSCCQGNRNELTPQQLDQIRTQGPSAVVDRSLAQQDASKLHKAGVKRLGTEESAFITVLALRHMYQLQATFDEYQKLSGKDLLKAISKETSRHLKNGLTAIVSSAKNRPKYFADKLHKSVKGLGTDDSRLIRILVSRSEIDLQDIKEVYLAEHHKTLAAAVASDTSGEYKRLLLAIIGQ